jgi:hypothetical protein
MKLVNFACNWSVVEKKVLVLPWPPSLHFSTPSLFSCLAQKKGQY